MEGGGCPPPLLRLLFLLQSEVVAWKQGHSVQKASVGTVFRPEILPGFRRMGRAAGVPGRAPLHRNPLLSGNEQPARPV